MSSWPWYPWYPADYQAKTAHLDYVQDSAYRRLLDYYYQQAWPIGSGIPADRPGLFRVCRAQTEPEKRAIEDVIAEFFYLNDNHLHHKAADEILAGIEHRKKRLSQAGHRGGLKAGRGRPIGTLTVTKKNREASSTDASGSSSSSISKIINQGANPKVALPDWLPLDHWKTFLAMRTRIRKPATPRAQRMLIGKLDVLREQGHNPAQLLAEAELKCWSSVYPPKE